MKEILLKIWLFGKRTDSILVFYIALLSLIPIFFTWGKLAIGGDVLIPFNHQGLEKFLYQWTNLQNGTYYYINYFPLYYFYRLVDMIGMTIYQASYLMLFLLNITAGVGILKLTRIFYQNKSWLFYSLPITFYLLSPALLNGWHYLYIYSFIPWFIYFIFKTIKSNKIEISDIIFLNIVIFFSSLDLPNPKYLFHLFFTALIIFILSTCFRMINFNFFIKNIWKIILFFVISLYIYLPLANFAFKYSPLDYGVGIKENYKQVGKMMDHDSAIINRMVRLHHNNLNLASETKKQYLSNPIIIASSFIFIIIVLLNFIRNKNYAKFNSKSELILLSLVAIYLFFSSGSNPPFGKTYEYIVTNFSLFAFLRTTAGSVFFLSLFYSMLLSFFVSKFKKEGRIVVIIIIIILITGYPLLKGDFYKNNFGFLNEYANDNEYGFKIPNEYFEIKESLDNKKIDAKVLHVNNDLSYINTEWGYFGVIYNFLYKNDQLGRVHIYSNTANHNVRFLYDDKSIIKNKQSDDKLNEIGELLNKKGFLEFNKVLDDQFLAHFYVPKNIIKSSYNIKKLPEIVSDKNYKVSSAIYLDKQNSGKLEKISNNNQNLNFPILEFKKINPTKYRVNIRGASDNFPLVFSESFHKNWKVYATQTGKKKESNNKIANIIKSYKILDGNDRDQASADELVEFINNGWIKELDSGEEKEIKHMKWKNDKERLDYIEKYNIDFISKNFQGTIQNNNLQTGKFHETWFASKSGKNNAGLLKYIRKNNVVELPEDNHLVVNGYANSWIINVNEICSESTDSIQNDALCIKNSDGSYDMELVIEFWPQRLFYIGLGLSGLTLIGCLTYLGYRWRKRRKSAILPKA